VLPAKINAAEELTSQGLGRDHPAAGCTRHLADSRITTTRSMGVMRPATSVSLPCWVQGGANLRFSRMAHEGLRRGHRDRELSEACGTVPCMRCGAETRRGTACRRPVRRGGVCPHHGHRGSRPLASVPPPPDAARSARRSTGSLNRSSARPRRENRGARNAAAGTASSEALLWIAFIVAWDGRVNPIALVVGAMLVLVPAGIGTVATARCGAWLKNQPRRCRRTRRGILGRCADHRGGVTLHDLVGAVAFMTALLNLVFFALQLGA
jgi:hypothetical protein